LPAADFTVDTSARAVGANVSFLPARSKVEFLGGNVSSD
jgi:hypothetical protein